MGLYVKSKVVAEKAAWDFQATLPEDERFELVTICPGFITGPPMRQEASAALGWLKRLMTGEMTSVSGDGVGFVDVRDVAMAHLKGIQVAGAANRRFILVNESPSFH